MNNYEPEINKAYPKYFIYRPLKALAGNRQFQPQLIKPSVVELYNITNTEKPGLFCHLCKDVNYLQVFAVFNLYKRNGKIIKATDKRRGGQLAGFQKNHHAPR
jgi:hypothetical protein